MWQSQWLRGPELLLAVYWTRDLAPPESLLLAQCANVAVPVTTLLGHGIAVRKICWGTEVQYRKVCWVTEDHRDSPGAPLLSRQVPPAFWGAVLFRAPV